MAIARFSSFNGNTFWKANAGANYVNSQTTVNVADPFPQWPRILSASYPDIGDGQPEYIWYRSDVRPDRAITGVTRYFARMFLIGFSSLSEPRTIGLNLTQVADNAFFSRITVDRPVFGPTSVDIFNGSLNQNTVEINRPYNWQKVYNFSRGFLIPAGADGFAVQFETKVVNYAQPGGTPQTNRAGFEYLIEIVNLPDGTSVNEAAPPTLTNPLN